MRSFVVIMVILASFFVCESGFAQTKGKSEKTEISLKKYKGIILSKPWTKSTQSYCAQGSDYFVLKVGKQEFVLENQSSINLADYKDKKVSFYGYEKTRTITPKDDGSQRPVQMSLDKDGKEIKETAFTCTVLIVQKKL